MSVKAVTWAFEQPVSGNEKCVLLALADFARDDGMCWPGQDAIAAKASVSAKTVQRMVAKLEERGLLYREARFRQDGARTSDLTVLRMPGCRQPKDTLTSGHSDPDQRTPMSGEPLVEPSGGVGARTGAALRVGGRAVNAEHWALTERVLAELNRVAGRKYRLLKSSGQPSQAATYVYKRIRDYPDLTFEEHASIIERTVASAWWGAEQATFNVVYGPTVFEGNITRSSANGNGAARREFAGDLSRFD